MAPPVSLGNLLREAGRYLALSPHSRLRHLAILRALDDRLLADIGMTRDQTRHAHAFKPLPASAAGASMIIIRDVTETDMAAVQAIYAHHVRHGLATFEEVPPSMEEMSARRAAVLRSGLPYLAAEMAGGIVGYSYATAYRPRPAYRHTIEDSVYVAEGFGGRGIGTALLGTLIDRCEAGPWRQMLAIIGDRGNAGSIALHRRFGFERVGTFQAVGFKLGSWVDTVLMQRQLGPGSATLPISNSTAKR